MKIKSLICLFMLAVLVFSSCGAKEPDNMFPVKPDKIIVGSGGVEKEFLPGDKDFDKILSYVRERADKSEDFGELLLAAHDPASGKHLSYEFRESETFVEFIYDECKGQSFNMSTSANSSVKEEKEVKRVFFSLTGEYHDCFFYSKDDNYKSTVTLGTLTDNTELITYVRELIE